MEESFQNSEGSNKDLLLMKCRDTIKRLEEELEISQTVLQDYDRRLKDSMALQSTYQEEIQSKNYQNKKTVEQYKALEERYDEFIQKALLVQQDNESLAFDLELMKKRYRELELSLEKVHRQLDESKVEVLAKSEIIKQWNGAMVEIEEKMRALSDEDRVVKFEYEKELLKNKELEKKVKVSEEEKISIFKSFQDVKEKYAVSKIELENREKLLQSLGASLEENKSKIVALEISLSEVGAKAKISQEEVKGYKGKVETLERQIKEQNYLYKSEVEKLNIALENKTSFFNKEDNRKINIITRLEADLRCVKEELENLTSTDSLLQSRYKDQISKYSKKKQENKDLKQEILSLTQSLARFEEKLKTIESSYFAETTSLKKENNSINEKLKKHEKNYCEKLDLITADYSKKLENLTEENSKLKNDFNKNTGDLANLLRAKEQEILILNDDRGKLQVALSELESKVLGLSRNLENSVADCWRLSSELSKYNDLKKEELNKLSDFYKLQLMRKDDEFQVQNERYSERLKEKLSSFYEKSSKFKETIRREVESFEYLIQNSQSKPELGTMISRLYSLLNSFII